jgi:DNA (cytosine-5)-methyltransferase 1
MKYLDLFSGVGGFPLGLNLAGIKFDWHGYSEIDKHALSVYKRRFPDAKRLKPVEHIRPKGLPKLDFVTFGFPCQDLSVSGKREGLGGKRSSLFFEAMRIIRAKKPRYFIFENVKGLYTINKGQDFIRVLQEIADAGYDGQWQLLNTRWFLPQNRERIYFIGHLRGEPRPEIFPIGQDEGVDFGAQGETQRDGTRVRNDNPRDRKVANTVSSRYYKDGSENLIEEKPVMLHNIYGGFDEDKPRVFEDYSPTIRTPKGGGHLPYVMLTETRTEDAKDKRREALKTGKDWSPRRGKELIPRNDDIANCVTANLSKEHYMMRLEDRKIRRLTPTEVERLQGFMWKTNDPDWSDPWTEKGIDEDGGLVTISNTQRYKMMGNAVSIPVVQAIGEKLKGYL